MGHVISSSGLKPNPAKIEAIVNMKLPTDKAGVKRLRGTVNYLLRFVPKLSDVIRPISDMTRPDVECTWDSARDKAFEEIKRLLTQAPVLAYFDSTKELSIQCDQWARRRCSTPTKRKTTSVLQQSPRRYRDKVRNNRKGDACYWLRSREMAPIHLWSSYNRTL